jgi:hypothetical protein
VRADVPSAWEGEAQYDGAPRDGGPHACSALLCQWIRRSRPFPPARVLPPAMSRGGDQPRQYTSSSAGYAGATNFHHTAPAGSAHSSVNEIYRALSGTAVDVQSPQPLTAQELAATRALLASAMQHYHQSAHAATAPIAYGAPIPGPPAAQRQSSHHVGASPAAVATSLGAMSPSLPPLPVTRQVSGSHALSPPATNAPIQKPTAIYPLTRKRSGSEIEQPPLEVKLPTEPVEPSQSDAPTPSAPIPEAPLRSITSSASSTTTSSLPPFLAAIYQSSRAELAVYDALIHQKITHELGMAQLREVEVVVGIPFYTEVANIHSVLVTMRDVFQSRRQRALFVILGEFARQDCVEDITDCHEIEMGETWEKDAYVSIETMWKPHPKYASKPWTVRALQTIASCCGPEAVPVSPTTPGAGGATSSTSSRTGAHLLIMDADIHFNHWELSAQSLVNALLDPLMQWDEAPNGALLHRPPSSTIENEKRNEHRTTVLPPPQLVSCEQPIYPTPLPLELAAACRATDGGEQSFSPIFAVRSPSEYPPTMQIPIIPQPSRDSTTIKSRAPPANFVVLNAPRSFFADDAIVHLVTYLHSYMTLGLEIHQGHGGEFSIHRDLNRAFLQDDTLVYDRTYCVESQMAHRAAFIHPVSHGSLFPSITASRLAGSVAGSAVSSPAATAAPPMSYPTAASASPPASTHPAMLTGSSVLEVLMKGKWHAKITLNKLLAFEGESAVFNSILHAGSPLPSSVISPPGTTITSPPSAAGSTSTYPAPAAPAAAPVASGAKPAVLSRARIDLVSEKLFNEDVFFSSMHLLSSRGSSPRPMQHHVGGPSYVPEPDPKAQSLKVLAPTSTRKQMVKSLKVYYHVLLMEHVSSVGANGVANKAMNLPIQSAFVQEFLPLLHRQVCKRQSSIAVNYIITHARSTEVGGAWHSSQITDSEKEKYLIFGPQEWAAHTVELLKIYRDSTRPEQRSVGMRWTETMCFVVRGLVSDCSLCSVVSVQARRDLRPPSGVAARLHRLPERPLPVPLGPHALHDALDLRPDLPSHVPARVDRPARGTRAGDSEARSRAAGHGVQREGRSRGNRADAAEQIWIQLRKLLRTDRKSLCLNSSSSRFMQQSGSGSRLESVRE